MGSEWKSWLAPRELPAGFSWRGFSGVESGAGQTWAWSIAGESTLTFPACSGGTVRYTFVAPVAGTDVELFVGARRVRSIRTARPWQEISGKVDGAFGPEQPLRLTVSRWNGFPEPFAAGDGRALALNFKVLQFSAGAPAALPVKTNKVCPYPFSKMETYSPNFAPCCTWWLENDLQFEGNDGDPWNSGAAQALRRSVLNGTYEFCKLDVCKAPLLEREELERSAEFELPIAPENLAALRMGLTELPAGPGAAVVLADPRCNLACPSCRKELITQLTPQESEQLRETDRQLEQHRESLRVLVLASNGEVFYSPFLRLKLKEATRERYPNLDYVEIISNGILFDEKSLAQLQPGSDLIRKARISIDAGDADTYRVVRGGDWDRLQKNLKWLGGLRRTGRLNNFRLNFVTRKENFGSLPDFFTLAGELGVDEVFVSRALPWTGAGFAFDAQDIFRADHPSHGAFTELWGGLRERKWPFQILGNV
jgi:hypothetical protein